MKVLFGILFVLLTFSGFAQTTEKAKGFVFNDSNKNGIFDSSEKGIKGVLVSNQKDVVLTNEDGHYELFLNEQSTLFITKPAGYAVPLNTQNLPQFYYHFQPNGSPEMEFPGIKKTGKIPENINFPMYKTQTKNEFSLLVLADVQVASNEEIVYFQKDVIAPALLQKYDVVISLGDLVHDDLSLLPGYNKSMALLEAPVYNVLGNHDVNYDVDEPNSSDTYKSWFGPNYYSFDYGEVHFICLENVERFCKKGEAEKYWDCYKGFVGETQLEWLKNDLKNTPSEKQVVICQHIAFEKNEVVGERMKVNNQNEIFEVLKKRENLLVLAGHKHTLQHDYFTKEDGWNGKNELHQMVCSSVSGSWWTGPKNEHGIPSSTQIDGVPNGYFILEFNGNEFIHNYYPAGNLKEQMRIENPLEKINTEEKEIIVNVFNSNKKSTVFAEIDSDRIIVLRNEFSKDPFIVKSFADARNEYKSWANPSNSTQLWKGEIPADLPVGMHSIKVTSIDEFQREFNTFAVFEIVK